MIDQINQIDPMMKHKSLLDKIEDINKQYENKQNNIKKQNDYYIKKIK